MNPMLLLSLLWLGMPGGPTTSMRVDNTELQVDYPTTVSIRALTTRSGPTAVVTYKRFDSTSRAVNKRVLVFTVYSNTPDRDSIVFGDHKVSFTAKGTLTYPGSRVPVKVTIKVVADASTKPSAPGHVKITWTDGGKVTNGEDADIKGDKPQFICIPK